MRGSNLWPLILILGLVLAFAAACQEKEKTASPPEQQPRGEQPAQPAPAKLSELDEAVRLYSASTSFRDQEKAVQVFYKYAYSNDPEGQYQLGLARWEGKGSQQSDLEAYVWWTIAAQQHHLEAMNRIEDVATRFDQEWLDEITNRANDWKERVRVTPELQ